MKFSELWLREWVNIKLNSETLFNQITMAGLKVDNTESAASSFKNIVIGEITECKKYSNIDHLYMTKVNVGDEHLLNIICNASNCRNRLKVVVATSKSILSESFKIKTLKLYDDIISEGMLCSFSELGIAEDFDGIIELPSNAPIGLDIRKYLKLDDNIIEINITPNRADCLSIIGLARDIAVINQIKFNIPKTILVKSTISDCFSIKVNEPKICPLYLGRIIKNINIKTSTPIWIKEKLRRCGIQSTNVVIDITNYVMLEFGQPILVLDKDKIKDGILVRMAKDGEILVLLNDKELKLKNDALVIADNEKLLAMGGIVVGKDSNINEQTKNILLECAFFYPKNIMQCARRYNIHTDASYRYERGVDPTIQHKAMERATYLIIEICGGRASSIIEVISKDNLPRNIIIKLRRKKLNRIMGCHISDMQVNNILYLLGCKVNKNQDEWEVLIPSWRFDIEIEEDLIEEIARIYGYNNIPNKSIQVNLNTRYCCESTLSLKRVKAMLNDKGYQEVITYSFVDQKVQQLIHPTEKALIIPNQISSKMSAMRLSLWTGLLETTIYNQNRQQNRIRIFETGLRFIPDEKADLGIRQDFILAGVISGNLYEEHWSLDKKVVDFYDMKGDLESILELTGKLSEIEFRTENISALHPGQSAAIYLCGKRFGIIGVVHPELERKLNLNSKTIIFELEWDKIANRVIPIAKKISRFPANRRDIAIVVNENVPAAEVLNECRKINLDHLVGVNLFDVYRGSGITAGYKSLAISLILQDTYRTLEEKEITATVAKCIEALKKRFKISLRD